MPICGARLFLSHFQIADILKYSKLNLIKFYRLPASTLLQSFCYRPLALVDGFYPDYHPEQKAAIQKTNKSPLSCKLINAFEAQTGS